MALVAFIVAFAIAVFPIFSHHFVSLNDVYNHVGRAAVLARDHEIPSIRTYWVPNWRLVPYLGYDLVEVGLLSWFSMGFVVKLMVTASLMAMFGGAVMLSRVAHGKWSAAVLLCALLLLNRTLLAGFINYLFGVGLSLAGAAAWIALRERSAVIRLVVLAAFATATCAVHLFSCGVLGVIVAGIELAILIERRSSFYQFVAGLACVGVAFLPALFLVVFVAPHPDSHLFVVYRSLASRLGAFAVPLTYAPIEEAVGFAAIGLSILALALAGRVSVDRRLAAAAGLLVLIQLAMPADIGTATVADHRIPIAFWLLLICAIDIRIERASLAAGFMALIVVVFLSRVALVQSRWTTENALYDAANQAMAALPGTSRVGTAYPASGLNRATRPAVALYYMPAMEFPPRGGFTQILFAISDQHALTMRPHYKQLYADAAPEGIWATFVTPQDDSMSPAARAKLLAAIKEYEYLIFIDAEPFDLAPTNLLEPVESGPGFRIFRVLPDAVQTIGAATGGRVPRTDTAAAKPHP